MGCCQDRTASQMSVVCPPYAQLHGIWACTNPNYSSYQKRLQACSGEPLQFLSTPPIFLLSTPDTLSCRSYCILSHCIVCKLSSVWLPAPVLYFDRGTPLKTGKLYLTRRNPYFLAFVVDNFLLAGRIIYLMLLHLRNRFKFLAAFYLVHVVQGIDEPTTDPRSDF